MKTFILQSSLLPIVVGGAAALFLVSAIVPALLEEPQQSPMRLSDIPEASHAPRLVLDEPNAIMSPDACIALLRAREGRTAAQAEPGLFSDLIPAAPKKPDVSSGQGPDPGKSLNTDPEFQKALLRLAQLQAMKRQADALEALQYQIDAQSHEPIIIDLGPSYPWQSSRYNTLSSSLPDFGAEQRLRQQQRDAELYRTNMLNSLWSINSELEQIRQQQQNAESNQSFQRYYDWSQNYRDQLTNQTDEMWRDHYNNLGKHSLP